jgi:hypothetical protein
MKTQSCRSASIKAVTTLAALVALTVDVRGGSIVQTVNFDFQSNDTTFDYYQQFNPASGTLLGVTIGVSGFANDSGFYFHNPTSQTITFDGTVSFNLNSDAGSQKIASTFSTTIDPNTLLGPYSAGGSYGLSNTYYSNLTPWIGTAQLGPFQVAVDDFHDNMFTSFEAGSDNPNIVISPAQSEFSNTGSETITYFFNAPGVPEPSSSLMLATAVVMVTGASLRARVLNNSGPRQGHRAKAHGAVPVHPARDDLGDAGTGRGTVS